MISNVPIQFNDPDNDEPMYPAFEGETTDTAAEVTVNDDPIPPEQRLLPASSTSRLTTQVASHEPTKEEVNEAKATMTRGFINRQVTEQLMKEGVSAAEIGDRIVEDFFDGDYDKALSRSRLKEVSLRDVVALIGRDGLCRLGRTALTQNVQIGAQRRLLGYEAVAGLDRGQQLALTSVKGKDEKLRWIECARKDGLGANKLRSAIKAGQDPKRPRKGKPGRKPKPLAEIIVQAFKKVGNHPTPKAFDAFWDNLDFTQEDPTQVQEFLKWTGKMIASLKKAEKKAKLVADAPAA